MEITRPEQLTSRAAQNYYKMITSGVYSPQLMSEQVGFAFDRKLMTLAEFTYLNKIIDEQILAESEKAVQMLGLK